MIKATHFIDSHYFMVKMRWDNYNCDYLINGKGYSSYNSSGDIIVKGDELEIRRVNIQRYISHYKHRDSDIRLSVEEYRKIQSGYRDKSGNYKSLDDEFASRKMQQDYIECYGSEEIISDPITYEVEEVLEHPDNKWIKPLYTIERKKYSDDSFCVFEWDAFSDFSEWVKDYMKSLGFKNREEFDKKSTEDFYVLGKMSDYTKFKLTGNEFFITDQFFGKGDGKMRGTYQQMVDERAKTINAIKMKIDDHIDAIRTKKVKKSTIKKLEELYGETKSRQFNKIHLKLGEILDEIK